MSQLAACVISLSAISKTKIRLQSTPYKYIHSASQKIPLLIFSDIFLQNGWELLFQILHVYTHVRSYLRRRWTIHIFIQLPATLTEVMPY